jgi:hypothetical protein
VVRWRSDGGQGQNGGLSEIVEEGQEEGSARRRNKVGGRARSY